MKTVYNAVKLRKNYYLRGELSTKRHKIQKRREIPCKNFAVSVKFS